MNPMVIDLAGLAGSILSFCGVIVAIWQVVKTRRAAEAANRAAHEAHGRLTRNLLLSDIATSSSLLETMKAHVRSGRYEAALVRVSDLMNHLNQLKGLPPTGGVELNFSEMLTNLHVLRDLLERKNADSAVKFDQVRVVNVLSDLSDELNGWIGSAKYLLPERGRDDS